MLVKSFLCNGLNRSYTEGLQSLQQCQLILALQKGCNSWCTNIHGLNILWLQWKLSKNLRIQQAPTSGVVLQEHLGHCELSTYLNEWSFLKQKFSRQNKARNWKGKSMSSNCNGLVKNRNNMQWRNPYRNFPCSIKMKENIYDGLKKQRRNLKLLAPHRSPFFQIMGTIEP